MSHQHFTFAPGFQAVVVGGLGGIGFAVVRLLRELGAVVAATGVSEAEVAACPLPASDTLSLHVLDVTDDAAVQAFAAGFDGVDLLVNCAGILRRDAE